MPKLDLIKPGDVLWERKMEKAGHTMMRREAIRAIYVVEVDLERRRVKAHWNATCNPAKWYRESTVQTWLKKRPEPKTRPKLKRKGICP